MKLSKIAKLCVRTKRVYLYDDPERGIQWVGDGHGLEKITFKENAYERENSYQSGRA